MTVFQIFRKAIRSKEFICNLDQIGQTEQWPEPDQEFQRRRLNRRLYWKKADLRHLRYQRSIGAVARLNPQRLP